MWSPPMWSPPWPCASPQAFTASDTAWNTSCGLLLSALAASIAALPASAHWFQDSSSYSPASWASCFAVDSAASNAAPKSKYPSGCIPDIQASITAGLGPSGPPCGPPQCISPWSPSGSIILWASDSTIHNSIASLFATSSLSPPSSRRPWSHSSNSLATSPAAPSAPSSYSDLTASCIFGTNSIR